MKVYKFGDFYQHSSRKQWLMGGRYWPQEENPAPNKVLTIASDTAYSFEYGSAPPGGNSTAEMYMTNNLTVTPIPLDSTWYRIRGATLSDNLVNFTHDAVNNRLTYTGTGQTLRVELEMSVESVGIALANDQAEYRIGLYQNGALVESSVKQFRFDEDYVKNCSLSDLLSLATNDFIEIYVYCFSALSIRVRYMNLVVSL